MGNYSTVTAKKAQDDESSDSSGRERNFFYDEKEDVDTRQNWHLTSSGEDANRKIRRCFHKCGLYCQQGQNNVFYVIASISQMLIIFNLIPEIILVTRAIAGKEPIFKSVAKPSKYYTMIVLKEHTARALNDLKNIKIEMKKGPPPRRSIKWSDPKDCGKHDRFYVKAPADVLTKLKVMDYTVSLYGDIAIGLA